MPELQKLSERDFGWRKLVRQATVHYFYGDMKSACGRVRLDPVGLDDRGVADLCKNCVCVVDMRRKKIHNDEKRQQAWRLDILTRKGVIKTSVAQQDQYMACYTPTEGVKR